MRTQNPLSGFVVCYIAFERKPQLEQILKTHGFEHISHVKAVDGSKLDRMKLARDNIITPRVLEDLNESRVSHSGMPSMGGVGCYLSHVDVWKMCVKGNHRAMIILEDDVDLRKLAHFLENKALGVMDFLFREDPAVYIDTTISRAEDGVVRFWFAHFYIVTNAACHQLLERAYPMDTQVDHYMAHMATIGKIKVKGEYLFGQKIHFSSIQDACWKCSLPNKTPWLHVALGTMVICMVVAFVCAKKCISDDFWRTRKFK